MWPLVMKQQDFWLDGNIVSGEIVAEEQSLILVKSALYQWCYLGLGQVSGEHFIPVKTKCGEMLVFLFCCEVSVALKVNPVYQCTL